LGHDVDGQRTRVEQAAVLDSEVVGRLARDADKHVFGPDEPDSDVATRFWGDVDQTRHGLTAELGFWKRVRAAVSLRSIRNPLHILRGAEQ